MMNSSSGAMNTIVSLSLSAESYGDANSSTTSEKNIKKALNPLAEEWSLDNNRASEEERRLYLTFSKGFPITEWEITCFFNQMFGPCVHTARLFQLDENPPLCAKVVFHFSYIPMVILGNEDEAYYWVNGKPMCCKRFEARKNQVEMEIEE